MFAYYIAITLHIIVCVILILVVLLQSGKGADLAGAFGGAATQTAFGSRGPASLLSKVTTVAAVLFMITSMSLSMMGTRDEERSILETTRGATPAATTPAEEKPQQPGTAPKTPEEIRKLQQEIEAKQNPGGTQTAPAQEGQSSGSPAETRDPAREPNPSSGQKP